MVFKSVRISNLDLALAHYVTAQQKMIAAHRHDKSLLWHMQERHLWHCAFAAQTLSSGKRHDTRPVSCDRWFHFR